MEKAFLLRYKGRACSVVLDGLKFDASRRQNVIAESHINRLFSASGEFACKDFELFQIMPSTEAPMKQIKCKGDIEEVLPSKKETQAVEEIAKVVPEEVTEDEPVEEVEKTETEKKKLNITNSQLNAMKVDELKQLIAEYDPEFDTIGFSKTELKEHVHALMEV